MPLLSSWRIAKWYDRLDAKRNAKQDAGKGIEFSQSKVPPFYWKEVADRGNMKVSGLSSGWLGGKVHQQLQASVASLDNTLFRLQRGFEQLKQAVDHYVNEIGSNPPPILKKPWYYLPLFIAIFVFDVAFNAVVFRIFGEPEFHTYLFTVGFVVALAVCAHIAGILSHELAKRENRVIVTLTTTVPLLLFVGIGLVRLYYLRSMYQEEGGSDSELAPIIDSNSFLLVFIAINLVMFVGAVVLSYSCHDPVRDQLVEAQKEEKKLFEAVLRALDWFKRLRGRWQRLQGQYLSTAHWYSNECDELMDIYGKVYERGKGQHDIRWPSQPKITIPKPLTDSYTSYGLSLEGKEMLKQLIKERRVELPVEIRSELLKPAGENLAEQKETTEPKEVKI